MFYLLENNRIVDSNEELKKGTSVEPEINSGLDNIKHNYLVGHFFGGFCVYGKIKKQSENVYELIEVGDLVKTIGIFRVDEINIPLKQIYSFLDKKSTMVIKTLGVKTIYKPNSNGDYIKVWEKKNEKED